MTALGDKMRDAGILVDRSRLFTRATDIVRRWGTAPIAVREFCNELMIDRELLEEIALEYLEARMKDMTSLPEEGHNDLETQTDLVPDRQSQEGMGRPHAETLPPDAQADSKGTGHLRGDTHPHPARPRTAAEIAGRGDAAKVIAKLTILDTYRLSNGHIVGDLYWASLHRINRASAFDTALTRLMMNHAQVSDPNAKVRDVLTPEQFQLLVQKAKEIADGM